MSIITGEGRNNFIVEYNDDAPAEYVDTGAYESTVALN